MTKKSVSEQEITDFINRRPQEEECGDTKVRHVQRLAELNHNGCNWSDAVFLRNQPDCDRGMVRKIITEAQLKFDLR